MTRIWTDGAEFGDTLFFDSGITVSGSPRSGLYRYTASPGYKILSTPLSEFYFRCCWSGISANNQAFLIFRNGVNQAVYFYCNGLGRVQSTLGNAGTITYTSWAVLEIHYKIDDSGFCYIKLDGVDDSSFVGDTKPSSYTTIDNIYWGDPSGGFGAHFDDIALNDTNGLTDNSWCGDGHIEVLMPNDNGDTNDWTGSDGDSVNNYLLVDERAHDTDTTYVKATTAVQDMYNVTDFTATNKIVTRIWAECRARDANVSAGAIKLGYKHGGTVYLSSTYRTLTGTYARVVGDEATVDPTDSTIWSEADLDAIQFVVENSSSSSSTSSSSSSSSSSSTTSSSSSTEIP